MIIFQPFLTSQDTKFIATRPAMGTPWQITLYATDSSTAFRLADSVFARIAAIEQITSDYRSDSEISKLVRLPARRYHPVSRDLFAVLAQSKRLAGLSHGAFDPTIGPLSKLWRRAFRQQQFPNSQEISRARSRVQWKWLRLRRTGLVRLRHDSMQLDLGGIAKGYALDEAATVLRTGGITSFLIEGGGDLVIGEPPPDAAGWTIVTPTGIIDTANVAIATSGSNYRYLEHGGKQYGHIIDPRSGLGVSHEEIVTVFASSAMVADGLASTLSVMTDNRDRLIKQYDRASFTVTAIKQVVTTPN